MSEKQSKFDLKEEVTMEHVLLLVFILPSVYMFVESFEFSSAAQHFPQFTSGMVILFGVLLLFRGYLPGPLRRLVVDEADILEPDARDAERIVEETDSDEEEFAAETSDTKEEETVAYGAAVLGSMCIGYLIGSFLIGMVWATPLFVIAYTWWRKQPIYAIVGLTLLSFGIAFLFYDIIGIPIEEGYLHEVFL